MNWSIVYFNEKVRREVMSMPAGIVADYLRLTDAMAVHGADLRMPHFGNSGRRTPSGP